MEGEREEVDLFVLPSRLGLGVYICKVCTFGASAVMGVMRVADSEDSCNSSVERWAEKEAEEASVYSVETATTAYASALESPFSSDASSTPSDTRSESDFFLGDGDDEDKATHVPFSKPSIPKNNQDYVFHCQKIENVRMVECDGV